MAEYTIALEGAARAALISAMLGLLAEHADRLASALSAADREEDPVPAHDAYHEMLGVGDVLDRLGWRADAPGSARLDSEEVLSVALAALRRERECAQEIAMDAERYGNTAESTQAAARLQTLEEALRSLEAQAARIGSPDD